MKISNLPDTGFKITVIKVLNKLERRIEFNKELENVTNNQSELTNTITEINILQGITSRLDNTEERINDMEDRIVEITQSEQQKGKKNFLKNQDTLRDFWAGTSTTLTFIL